jgi:hypothetical protein
MTCTCESNAPGIYLCHADAVRLEQVLAELDSVVGELVRAVPRASLTASYGERVSSSASQFAPLPVNEGALDAHIALDRYLMVTALELAKITRAQLPGRDTSSLSSYILTHIGTLRTQTWAADVEPTLRALVNTCENVTRIAEKKVFGGTCSEDGTDLYAVKGSDIARCKTCGTTYEVIAWRAHARTAKEYHIGTPAELSRALSSPAYGIEVSSDLIWRWAKRGKLERANEEANEHGEPLKPTYRLSDVLDLNAKRKPLDGTAA